MMGVNLRHEDENGDCLGELRDPGEYLAWIDRLLREDEKPLLRFIDPYGDTVFNRLQVPRLLTELRLARKRATNERIRSLANAALQRSKVYDKPKVYESIRRQIEALDPRAVRRHIGEMIRLAENCERELHTNLKFYGA